jgi:DNA adenine methylase
MLKTVFRYPGGKTKLTKNILQEMREILNKGSYDVDFLEDHPNDFTFVDVFVGGGSVALGVANEYPASSLILNDLDEWMYCFWKEIINGNAKKLTSSIMNTNPPNVQNFEHWRERIEKGDLTKAEKAFVALFFNRTAFSGIFKSGPMGGFSQKGKYKIDCRYNAQRMVKMIEDIATDFTQRKVECYQEDYKTLIERYRGDENMFLYLDPPYMKQGKQLYNHHMQKEQYQEMADLLKNDCKAKWLVSHDDNPEFVEMFKGWANIKNIEGVAYTINSIKGKKRTELLISA